MNRALPRILVLLACLVVAGCLQKTGEPEIVDTSPPPPVQPGEDPNAPFIFIQASPHPRIGRVAWVAPGGGFAVVRLDQPITIEYTYLASVDGNQNTLAVFRVRDVREGNSVGAEIVEGRAVPGMEVLMPGKPWIGRLRGTYGEP